jgi:hypothetical protein
MRKLYCLFFCKAFFALLKWSVKHADDTNEKRDAHSSIPFIFDFHFRATAWVAPTFTAQSRFQSRSRDLFRPFRSASR